MYTIFGEETLQNVYLKEWEEADSNIKMGWEQAWADYTVSGLDPTCENFQSNLLSCSENTPLISFFLM
jgi:hypothetical protein